MDNCSVASLGAAIAGPLGPSDPRTLLSAIEPARYAELGRLAEAGDTLSEMRLPEGRQLPTPMQTMGEVAVLDVVGPLSKRPSPYGLYFQASSTQALREAVQEAGANKDVKAVLLRVDSPGGSVDGLAELGDDLFALRSRKTLWAQVDGLAASAGYYLAAQAERIFAGRMDLVGSIGTRMMVYDWHRLFAKEGVEALPIDTGPFKSAGAMGTEVTAEQRAYFQSIVDAYYGDFLAAIQRGRGMAESSLRAVADGRVFPATDAMALGLIDGIQTFEQTLAELQATAQSRVPADPRSAASGEQAGAAAQETSMSTATDGKPVNVTTTENSPAPGASEPAREQAAAYHELVAACPGATSEFVCEQLERRASVAQAKDAWIALQNEQLKASREQAQQTANAGAANNSGFEPLGTAPPSKGAGGEPATGEATDQFDEAVRERMAGGMSRESAIGAVAREQPELHQAFLLATNPRAMQQALIRDKFAGE